MIEDPPEIPTCADPEFGGTHPTATEYECEGRAGGAIVYRQIIINFDGPKGGPGAVQTDPAVTEFPDASNQVSACCHSLTFPDDNELVGTACQSDCGRAACNRVLDSLREAVMSADPSDGACDPLPGVFQEDCQDRVRASLQSWIDQIEANYEICVFAAVQNSDPSLAYADPSQKFRYILEFADHGCETDQVGCLYDAELRPFCQIDAFTQQSTCEAAGNPIDEAATDDGGSADESTGGGGGGSDPFGDIGQLVYCDPETTCILGLDLIPNVASNFHVLWDEGVLMTLDSFASNSFTGLQISGLDNGEHSKELLDALSFVNGDVITHVNGTALDSWEDVAAVADNIDNVSAWTVKVKREPFPSAIKWLNRTYTISLAVTFGGKTGTNDPVDIAASGGGQQTDQTTGGCGCTQGSAPQGAALMLLGLFGFVIRRR